MTIVSPDSAAQTKTDALEALGAKVIRIPFEDWWQVLLARRFEGAKGVFFHPVAETAGGRGQRHHRRGNPRGPAAASTPSSPRSAAAD